MIYQRVFKCTLAGHTDLCTAVHAPCLHILEFSADTEAQKERVGQDHPTRRLIYNHGYADECFRYMCVKEQQKRCSENTSTPVLE